MVQNIVINLLFLGGGGGGDVEQEQWLFCIFLYYCIIVYIRVYHYVNTEYAKSSVSLVKTWALSHRENILNNE